MTAAPLTRGPPHSSGPPAPQPHPKQPRKKRQQQQQQQGAPLGAAGAQAPGAGQAKLKNVTWDKRRFKYRATLYLKGTRVHVG